MEKKHWDILDKSKIFEESFCQGINDYKIGGMFYGLFLAPKIKYCSSIVEFGIIEEQKTLNGVLDSKNFLDRQEYFKLMNGRKWSQIDLLV